MAGNIGRGVLDIEPAVDGEVVVLELSSYQTDLARALTPDIAVFTNLSPDHLDRHGGMGGYFAAKRRLFAEGGPDRAVIGVDEVEGRYLANQMGEGPEDDRVIRISSGQKLDGPGWAVFARKGFLSETRKGRQVASIDLRAIPGLPGAHNHQNACAAYAACRALGLGPKLIEQAFQSFKGLPHRSQLVRERAGVRYVNDSKATNVDSAAKALQAFQEYPLDRRRDGQGRRHRGAGTLPRLGREGLSDRPFGAGISPCRSAPCRMRSARRWRSPWPARRRMRWRARWFCWPRRRRVSTNTRTSRSGARISWRRSRRCPELG